MHNITVIPMVETEYNNVVSRFKAAGFDDDLWDYPLEELEILCYADHRSQYALIGNRLFELPTEWEQYKGA